MKAFRFEAVVALHKPRTTQNHLVLLEWHFHQLVSQLQNVAILKGHLEIDLPNCLTQRMGPTGRPICCFQYIRLVLAPPLP